MIDFGESLVRLLAALVVGAAIGIDRDMQRKPTGVRLHGLVAIGSALFVMMAAELGSTLDAAAASRIIQGIVGGIGFLGAGVINRAPTGERIHHITTAATIWITAALGVACGLGAWRMVAVAAVLVLIILVAGRWIDHRLFGRAGNLPPGDP